MRRPDTKPRADILESEIESYLCERASEVSWLCEKMRTTATLGFPDRCIIADGRVVFVEVKRPDHKPRKMQVRVLRKLAAHGAEVCVVHDADTVDALIETLRASRPIEIVDDTCFYIVSTPSPTT